MASNGEKSAFPPVELKTTLYDLLRDDLIDGEKLETLCLIKPNSDYSYGNAVPLSDKYIIHQGQVSNGDDLAHLQLEICSYLLLFFVGRMDVIFMGSEGLSDDPTLSRDNVDKNAKRSFGVIQESQRPRITTYANPEDLVKHHDGNKIRWGFGMDLGERLPWHFHPELIYLINSKRWLADCDLKSANDLILDCQINCREHITDNNAAKWYYGGKDCEDCAAGVKAEIQRIRAILEEKPLPYVLKLTQSLSAVGTNITQNEEERKDLVERMTTYLQDYLPRITKDNAHMETTSLIVSDFIKGPTMALNFHVKRDGSVIFLGACHQLSTGESGRQATAITYADQDKLQKRYQGILDKVGKVLQSEGYYGPVGADVLEHPDDGTQYAIDLNVRTPLSLVLYLLGKHFNENRNFGMSLVYECIMLTLSREDLEEKFRQEFEEGRIVLLGGTKMGKRDVWAYGVVVAGEDKEALDKLSERILEDEAQLDVGADS